MKRAVVLAGGGARGPYQIGVWQALLEMGIDYQIVTGTSVGALNGALMVQRDFNLAKRLWESLSAEDVIADLPRAEEHPGRAILQLLRHSREHGGLDISPLERIVRQVVDEQKLRTSDIAFGVVTVSYPSFRPVQLVKEEIPQGELVDYLLASASYFPFFTQREIGGTRYVDGAYHDNLPSELALHCGAEEIIAVDLAAVGIVRPYHGDVPVTYIRSYWDLGQLFVFDPQLARRNIRLGYQDAMKAMRRLEGHSYAFLPGQTAENARRIFAPLDAMRRKTGVSVLKDYTRLPQLQNVLRARVPAGYRGAEPAYTIGCAITSAAEIAAEILGIEPDATYTFERFNRLLIERSAQLLILPPHSEHALLPETKSDGKKAAKSRPALSRFLHWLNGAYGMGRLPERFWALAALFPREFAAANYLMALRISLLPESL